MQKEQNTFAFKSQINQKLQIDHYSIFKRLEVFIKIVDCNSLSLASQKLKLTPSAVSRTLAKLEVQLGITLLKRTTRNIVLTDAGKYLYDKANELLNNLEDSLIKTSSFYDHPQGQLKITCSIAFGASHLMKLFSEYRKYNDDVNLSVNLNDDLINLNEENIDIALRITQTPPVNFSIRKICVINWVYCASPQYLKKFGIPETISELSNHHCLVNPNTLDVWEDNAKQQEEPLKIKGVIEANSSLALLEAALNHQGIVCLPTYILGDYIKSKQLKPILLSHISIDKGFNLYALYSPSKYSDPKVRSFIDFLVEKIQNHITWDDWMKEYEF